MRGDRDRDRDGDRDRDKDRERDGDRERPRCPPGPAADQQEGERRSPPRPGTGMASRELFLSLSNEIKQARRPRLPFSLKTKIRNKAINKEKLKMTAKKSGVSRSLGWNCIEKMEPGGGGGH